MHLRPAGKWIDNHTRVICLNFKHVVFNLVDGVGQQVLELCICMLDELLGDPLRIGGSLQDQPKKHCCRDVHVTFHGALQRLWCGSRFGDLDNRSVGIG